MSYDLLNIIKKASVEAIDASNPTSVLFGKVISTYPLKISIEQRMTLTQEFLILTKNVTNYEINIEMNVSTENTELHASIEDKNIDMTHNHNILKNIKVTIDNELKINDDVILLRMQGGQKYIVLDRLIKK